MSGELQGLSFNTFLSHISTFEERHVECFCIKQVEANSKRNHGSTSWVFTLMSAPTPAPLSIWGVAYVWGVQADNQFYTRACPVSWHLNPLGPTVIKGKLLQSSYEQLWAVQYNLRVAVNPPAKCSMEKLTGDLLLELKFVKLEILSTSFKDFLYGELGELVIWVWMVKGTHANEADCFRQLTLPNIGEYFMANRQFLNCLSPLFQSES